MTRTTENNGGHYVRGRIETPLGPMIACASDEALALLEFADDLSEIEGHLRDVAGTLPDEGSNRIITATRNQLAGYFAGDLKEFDLPLSQPGTDFQQSVWKELCTIPYGTTTSYGAIARSLGDARAVRAVGTANGRNRVAIIVPCHRVVGSDGTLVGYAGGKERKRTLLALEGASAPVPEGQEQLF